jgi:hypothetical protein
MATRLPRQLVRAKNHKYLVQMMMMAHLIDGVFKSENIQMMWWCFAKDKDMVYGIPTKPFRKEGEKAATFARALTCHVISSLSYLIKMRIALFRDDLRDEDNT